MAGQPGIAQGQLHVRNRKLVTAQIVAPSTAKVSVATIVVADGISICCCFWIYAVAGSHRLVQHWGGSSPVHLGRDPEQTRIRKVVLSYAPTEMTDDSNTPNSSALIPSPAAPKRAQTLFNIFQAWLDHVGKTLSVSSVENYREALERFEVFAAGRPLDASTWLAYQRYLLRRNNREHEDGYISIPKLHSDLGIARRALKWAASNGLAADKITDRRLPLPKMVRKPATIFTREEYERMKECCTGSYRHVRHQVIVTCYATGMYITDVCLLKWSSVDLDKQVIRYTPSRLQSRECVIPIITGSDFHELLIELDKTKEETIRCWTPEHYVFKELSYAHLQRERMDIHDHITVVFKKAGIKNRNHRAFHRTLIGDLLNAGVDLWTVIEITGCRNLELLRELCHPRPDDMHEAMKRREAYALTGERVDRQHQASPSIPLSQTPLPAFPVEAPPAESPLPNAESCADTSGGEMEHSTTAATQTVP